MRQFKKALPHPFLCILILLLFQLSAVQAADPGDVDGNGVIDQVDVVLIKDHLIERSPLTGEALVRADANLDGTVDLEDIAYTQTLFTPPDNGGETITITLPGGVTMDMVRIPAGSFQMGSPDTERYRDSDEGPVHTVNIEYDFYMGQTEVTQAQWLAVMGSWPSTAPSSTFGVGNDYPAYYISWDDCQDFITALNQHIVSTGQGPATFRLPSEAEWEYACRAGTTTRFYFGDSLDCGDTSEDCAAGILPGNRSDYMWYFGNNTPFGSKEVGQLLPNAFGLYDMHGNVWEWCQDYWHSDYTGAPADGSAWESQTSSDRAVRGGGWGATAGKCRSAGRDAVDPGGRGRSLGVRLLRTP